MNLPQFEAIKTLPLILPITKYPDTKLNQVSKPVLSGIVDDKSLQELLDAMVETVEGYEALGLSAIQVGIPLSAFVARTPYGILKFINPAITKSEGTAYEREGCLSVPGVYPKVTRAEKVTVEYFDETGEKQTYDAEGYWARVVQHEIEHLTGKTFFDSLDKFSRDRELKNYKNAKRKVK